jgi:hypothetical protein
MAEREYRREQRRISDFRGTVSPSIKATKWLVRSSSGQPEDWLRNNLKQIGTFFFAVTDTLEESA